MIRFLRTTWALPAWAPPLALAIALAFAWVNFLSTGRWANLPGALQGWRLPWYAAALVAATAGALWHRRRIGQPVSLGPAWLIVFLAAGAALLVAAWGCRMSPAVWGQIPFKDDWTELYQQAVNGVALLKRGVVVGWNWGLFGGYPTSTDIAQNLGTVGFLPTTIATIFAFLSGYAAIAFLLRFLAHHTTAIFVAYRLVLGVVVLALAGTDVID